MIGPDGRKPIPVSYVIATPLLVVILIIIGALLLKAIVVDEIRKIFGRANLPLTPIGSLDRPGQGEEE